MRTRSIWIALILLASIGTQLAHPATALPDSGTTVRTPEVPDGDGGPGTPPPACQDAPGTLVDKCVHEPSNNECGGAVEWPVATVVTSTGSTGGKVNGVTDAADWSLVELYATETLAVTGVAPAFGETGSCDARIGGFVPDDVTANGWYPMVINAANDAANVAYTATVTITPNDPSGPGTDVSNDASHAWPVNAFSDGNPNNIINLDGSLPNREAQVAPDQDWYQIHVIVDRVDPGTGPAVGLLTVTFDAACNGGTYSLTLYGPDGITRAGDRSEGCGEMEESCIAISATPVFAKTAVDRDTGTGYSLKTTVYPLKLILDPTGYLVGPSQQFCDPVTPVLLGVLGDGTSLVDGDGNIVAQATTTLP